MAEEEKAGWEYKPDDKSGGAVDDSETSQPAKTKAAKSVSWTASEYIDHQQGPGWYLGLTVVTVALSVIIYFITRDFFGVGITLAAGIILAVFASKKPRQLQYEISGEGLRIEQKLYPYRLFKSYAVIEDGALMSLNLLPLKRFMPPVSAYFAPADQAKITKVLDNYLAFEPKSLDSIDRLSRRLRF